jgi:3-deoxy-manno-octulosonate cytidylyltransferase (CMP-KDO synthetase)
MKNKPKNNIKTFILVPARLKSERLKKKMIKKFSDGTTVIGRTIEQCKKTGIETLLVTDSKEISNEVNLPFKNIFIEKRGNSGTERLSYFLNNHNHNIKDEDYCLIVLGDQPEIEVELIKMIEEKIKELKNEQDINGLTLHFKSNHLQDYLGTKNCKMIIGKNNIVYYISRSPIPGFKEKEDYKNKEKIEFNQHVSIVCLKAKWIKEYLNLKDYNTSENNEWLRFILNGCKIKSFKVEYSSNKSIDVNNEEDWNFYESKYKNRI